MNSASLRDLESLYSTIQEQIRGFRDCSNLACPDGCGKCCDHADTEVFPLEAELVAGYILESHPLTIEDLASRVGDENRVECVFYDREARLHCMVYPARPLICRSYGDYGIRDKIGTLYFDLCPHLIGADRYAAGGGLVRLFSPPHPPILSDYEDRVRSLHKTDMAKKRPLGQAVLRALGGV